MIVSVCPPQGKGQYAAKEDNCKVMWYLKKMWLDQEPGIEAVIIHYTCTPLGQAPNWQCQV
jgi:hypothetical protein